MGCMWLYENWSKGKEEIHTMETDDVLEGIYYCLRHFLDNCRNIQLHKGYY